MTRLPGAVFVDRFSTDVVYFVESHCGTLVKIGKTKAPPRLGAIPTRFLDLSNSNAHPLRWLGCIKGSFNVERWFHNECIAWRDHAEWFRNEGGVPGIVSSALEMGHLAAHTLCPDAVTSDRGYLTAASLAPQLPNSRSRAAKERVAEQVRAAAIRLGMVP